MSEAARTTNLSNDAKMTGPGGGGTNHKIKYFACIPIVAIAIIGASGLIPSTIGLGHYLIL
jgi:hypothetical protein